MNLYYYVVKGGELLRRLHSLQILKAKEKRARLDVIAKYDAYDIGADSNQNPYLAYPYIDRNPMFKHKRIVVDSGFDNMYAHFPDTRCKAGRQLLKDMQDATYITKTDLVHNTEFGEPDGKLRMHCQPILIVKPEYDLLIMAVWNEKEPEMMQSEDFVQVNPKSLVWLDDHHTDSVQSALDVLQSYTDGAVFSSNIVTYKSRTERLLDKLSHTSDKLEAWRLCQRIQDMCDILDMQGVDTSGFRTRIG